MQRIAANKRTITESLTPRQRRFVEEYLVDLNASQAYLRAGYGGSSASAARTNAARLLRRPQVQAAIERRMAERSGECRVDVDEVIAKLRSIALADLPADATGGAKAAQVRASELLLRYCGYDKPRGAAAMPELVLAIPLFPPADAERTREIEAGFIDVTPPETLRRIEELERRNGRPHAEPTNDPTDHEPT